MSDLIPVPEPAKRATWFTQGAASRFLGVSAKTLKRWTENGKIVVHAATGDSPGGYTRDDLVRLRAELRAPAGRFQSRLPK